MTDVRTLRLRVEASVALAHQALAQARDAYWEFAVAHRAGPEPPTEGELAVMERAHALLLRHVRKSDAEAQKAVRLCKRARRLHFGSRGSGPIMRACEVDTAKAGLSARRALQRLEWAERLLLSSRLRFAWGFGASVKVRRKVGFRLEMEGLSHVESDPVSDLLHLSDAFESALVGDGETLPLTRVRGRTRFAVVLDTGDEDFRKYLENKQAEGLAAAEVGFWNRVSETGAFIPRWYDVHDHGASAVQAMSRIESLEERGFEVIQVACQVQLGPFRRRRRLGDKPKPWWRKK